MLIGRIKENEIKKEILRYESLIIHYKSYFFFFFLIKKKDKIIDL